MLLVTVAMCLKGTSYLSMENQWPRLEATGF